MATITFTAVRLTITVDSSDNITNVRQRQNETVTVETSGDGFFTYRTADFDILQEADLTGGDVQTISLGGRTFNAGSDDLNLSMTRFRTDGETRDLLGLDFELSPSKQDVFFILLDGPALPNLGSASLLNDFIADSNISAITTGPFRPGAQIDLADIPDAQVTEPDVVFGDGAIFGTPGADDLDGTAGADEIDGLGGADTIDGFGGADFIRGAGGRDEISGGGGKDTLEGGGGRDELNGGGGRDELAGGGGRDELNGGGGRDSLEGGKGKDELTGGGGRDNFVFSRGDGRDTITDYRDRQDKIEILDGASAFGDLTITQAGDDARIRFSNVTITLEDTNADVLNASDFIFS